jgi:anaerobic selenocysteine-containing dehydrogenase
MTAVRTADGAEAVVFAQGTDRNYQEWLFRFANSFGSPNVLGPAHVCFYPRMMAGILSMGDFTFCDYEGTPQCLVVWGSNKLMTHADGVIGTRLLAAQKRGTQLVVIDPRETELARRAKYWLQVRPGTDLYLALALLHVVLSERRYDRSFVEQYTHGFDRLEKHVEPFTPEMAAEITSVPATLIREVGRFYSAASPAAVEVGTGIEQNRDSFQVARALSILSAVTGNIDRPGGDIIWDPSGLVGRRTFPLHEALSAAQRSKRLGSDRHKVLGMASWAHPQAVWTAILDEQPYPVRMMLVFGSNLLVSYAESERVYAALQRLPFLVTAELFLTPTAAMADIVLPVGGWLEREQVVEHAHYVASRKKLAQVGECRSDEEILMDLAERLQLPGIPWRTTQEAINYKLAPTGEDWSTFQTRHYKANHVEYFKYRKQGFRTRSGKFNLYCEGLEKLGYSPLPIPSSQVITGELPAAHTYLLTSAHSRFYFNSEFRQLSGLRRREPDPLIEIHPDAAAKEGIVADGWVLVCVNGKSARFRARLTNGIASDVVCVSSNWWYPELPFAESWRRSNVNCLTSDADANAEMGSSNFRGITCTLMALAKLGESERAGQLTHGERVRAEQERNRQANLTGEVSSVGATPRRKYFWS